MFLSGRGCLNFSVSTLGKIHGLPYTRITKNSIIAADNQGPRVKKKGKKYVKFFYFLPYQGPALCI